MSMEDLAQAIGVQRSAINKYEKDRIDLKVSTIRSLSKALDVPIMYLLEDDVSSEEQQLLTAWRMADDRAHEDAMKTLLSHSRKKTIESSAI